MAAYLNGIKAKLARADTHLKAIKLAIKPIIEAEPDLIPGEFDSASGEYLFRATRDSGQPDEISPVIGDFVHNLRATLDYMLWAMTSPAVRADPKKARKIEFPIWDDYRTYDAGVVQKLVGVPDKAQAVIKCLQPFNGPDCRPNFSLAHPRDRPLWHLYELDNWDKHRTLNLTEHTGEMDFVFPMGFHIQSAGPMGFPFAGFKRGAVFARFNMKSPEPDVEMYLRTTYDVAFDSDGPESVAAEPVLQTLLNIRSEIRHRVLPSLRKFIPK